MDYEGILARLTHVKKEGRYWCAVCPVRPGRHNRRSFRLWVGGKGQLIARCYACGAVFPEIVRALGTKYSDWFPPEPEKPLRKPIVPDRILARYPFRTASGDLLFEEVRLQPFPGQSKRVRYRRPIGDDWAWSLQKGVYRKDRVQGWRLLDDVVQAAPDDLVLDAVPLAPYHLPELAERPDDPVLVVEGPRDADTLALLGFLSSCSPCGARNWKPSYGVYFEGRRVTVIPDADQDGEVYAMNVLGSLLLHGAASIRLVRLGRPGGPKDASAFVESRWGVRPGPRACEAARYALKAMIRNAPEWKPGVVAPFSSTRRVHAAR